MAELKVTLSAFVLVSLSCLIHLSQCNAIESRYSRDPLSPGASSAPESERRYIRVPLSRGASGPESIAFDCQGQGPYVGVSDGRILKWRGFKLGWKEIGYTSPNWDRTCLNSTNRNISISENKCGRPLGLRFHPHSCQLYVADAYYGLVVLNNNGQPIQVATTAGGMHFTFTNGLDIDPFTGFVYFTDSSMRFQRWEFLRIIQTGDSTGQLIRYNPNTKSVNVLKSNLSFANGVAVSKNGDFLLVAETGTNQTSKYWLRGPRFGTFEPFIHLKAGPDNISRNQKDEFWIALVSGAIFGKKVDETGRTIESLYAMTGEVNTSSISHIEEFAGKLWIGSLMNINYIIITNS